MDSTIYQFQSKLESISSDSIQLFNLLEADTIIDNMINWNYSSKERKSVCNLFYPPLCHWDVTEDLMHEEFWHQEVVDTHQTLSQNIGLDVSTWAPCFWPNKPHAAAAAALAHQLKKIDVEYTLDNEASSHTSIDVNSVANVMSLLLSPFYDGSSISLAFRCQHSLHWVFKSQESSLSDADPKTCKEYTYNKLMCT